MVVVILVFPRPLYVVRIATTMSLEALGAEGGGGDDPIPTFNYIFKRRKIFFLDGGGTLIKIVINRPFQDL